MVKNSETEISRCLAARCCAVTRRGVGSARDFSRFSEALDSAGSRTAGVESGAAAFALTASGEGFFCAAVSGAHRRSSCDARRDDFLLDFGSRFDFRPERGAPRFFRAVGIAHQSLHQQDRNPQRFPLIWIAQARSFCNRFPVVRRRGGGGRWETEGFSAPACPREEAPSLTLLSAKEQGCLLHALLRRASTE